MKIGGDKDRVKVYIYGGARYICGCFSATFANFETSENEEESSARDVSSSVPKPRRQRTFFTSAQVMELERFFKTSNYVTKIKREALAEKLKLSSRNIKIWFQNRRQKEAKKNQKKEDGTVIQQAPWPANSATSTTVNPSNPYAAFLNRPFSAAEDFPSETMNELKHAFRMAIYPTVLPENEEEQRAMFHQWLWMRRASLIAEWSKNHPVFRSDS